MRRSFARLPTVVLCNHSGSIVIFSTILLDFFGRRSRLSGLSALSGLTYLIMSLHGSDSPAWYAEKVISYSKNSPQESLYHGQDYQPLANFLSTHYGDSQSESCYRVPAGHRDLTVGWYYLLHREIPRAPKPIMSLDDLNNLRRDHARWQPSGGLLFLRGYPSPEWLTSLGSQYDVNPEFWARHMDFLSAPPAAHITTPWMLPSSSDDVFRLRFTTVGSRGPVSPPLDRTGLKKLRESSARQMEQYEEKLRYAHLNPEWRHGDSIVRRFTIHDQEYFSFDQVGTIYLSRPDETTNNWLSECSECFESDLHWGFNT